MKYGHGRKQVFAGPRTVPRKQIACSALLISPDDIFLIPDSHGPSKKHKVLKGLSTIAFVSCQMSTGPSLVEREWGSGGLWQWNPPHHGSTQGPPPHQEAVTFGYFTC